MANATGRESDKFMLRLPDGMRDRIKAAAEANNRSMNSEIVATLEEKYPPSVSVEKLQELLTASAGLLDVIEGLPSFDEKVLEHVALLRSYLKDAKQEAQSGNDATERQRLFDETRLIFDQIARSFERGVEDVDRTQKVTTPTDDD